MARTAKGAGNTTKKKPAVAQRKLKAPVVTVCIPVYNTEAFIGKAVDSVISQTFQDFEILIYDNHSTDKTMNVVRKYRDKRIKVVQHSRNLGAEANWNAVVKAARGRFIKILCADDFLYPSALETQLAVLNAPDAQNVVLTCAARHIVDDTDRILMKRGPGRMERIAGENAVRRTIRRGTNIFGETSSALFRKDAREKAGLFTAAIPYVIDLDMWTRMLRHGDVVFTPEVLSAYRVGAASWSMEIMKKQGENFLRFIGHVRKTPGSGVTPADAWIGKVSARVQAFLRQVFYRFFLPRTAP